MAKTPAKWLVLIVITMLTIAAQASEKKKIYIIQMDRTAKPNSFSTHLDWYTSKINSVILVNKESSNEQESTRIVYSYSTAFHGVAAHLSSSEASELERQEGVTAVFPETKYELHTTRSPMFLGLDAATVGAWSAAGSGAVHDVVVGVLDTGIWPEGASFSDAGMSPVPARWKGQCETGRGFEKRHCNKKIVGARSFYRGYEAATGKMDPHSEYISPRDQDGHGTHTAATVAGSPVRGASLLGYARGTARGMSPGARVAAYKVCWMGGCFSSDILAAVDKAVSDGVDVLSISLGGGVSSYYKDSLSVASFGAMEKGVFVSCSAGNGGPDPVSLTNVSPWIATVGASTMDRDFPATVRLSDRRNFSGASLYKDTTKGITKAKETTMYPVVYMGSNSSSPDPSSLCLEGTLERRNVAGKIVICDRGISPRVQKGQVVKDAGGVGMILANTAANGEELVADSHLIPAVALGESEATVVKRYVLSEKKPAASLAFLGTRLGVRPSPVVAAFSSRGPNFLTLEILKPDMVAPGVNILAAWTGALGPSSLPTDTRRVGFNILSGTSMSCPHVSGIAALIKSRHPRWTPAAVKSALMTTAYVHDNTLGPLRDAAGPASGPYEHGAGHVNPVKALDPGLVYDISAQDYFEFLCSQGLTKPQLAVFAKYSNRTCGRARLGPADLNYPAVSVVFQEKASPPPVMVRRTATNVGPAGSEYRVSVSAFKGVEVAVEPRRLRFSQVGQRLSYKVTFTSKNRQMVPEFGDLVWKDGTHKVRSPIAVTWLPPMM